ncbi:translation initiation factor IF-2-like [Manacus candei]|uniref:translation initiation factor IF-2-like n=1 Tax=Manacus candei TaxID=415023 RepID=UPI002227E380|nr:translation initiation factor IF-2-like [Manacus candei]
MPGLEHPRPAPLPWAGPAPAPPLTPGRAASAPRLRRTLVPGRGGTDRRSGLEPRPRGCSRRCAEPEPPSGDGTGSCRGPLRVPGPEHRGGIGAETGIGAAPGRDCAGARARESGGAFLVRTLSRGWDRPGRGDPPGRPRDPRARRSRGGPLADTARRRRSRRPPVGGGGTAAPGQSTPRENIARLPLPRGTLRCFTPDRHSCNCRSHGSPLLWGFCLSRGTSGSCIAQEMPWDCWETPLGGRQKSTNSGQHLKILGENTITFHGLPL